MNYKVKISKEASEYLNKLDEKSRRIILAHLAMLGKNPFPGVRGDKEKLHLDDGTIIYRVHVGRSHTAFYRIDKADKLVRINEVLTIEQAHKKYGRL